VTPTLRRVTALTIASVKMIVRDRTALFFSLAFPIVFMVLFGLIFGPARERAAAVGCPEGAPPPRRRDGDQARARRR
jgi:hypothetical protein